MFTYGFKVKTAGVRGIAAAAAVAAAVDSQASLTQQALQVCVSVKQRL
jgi:hypothetical protein